MVNYLEHHSKMATDPCSLGDLEPDWILKSLSDAKMVATFHRGLNDETKHMKPKRNKRLGNTEP